MTNDDNTSREQLAWVSAYYDGDLNPTVIAAARQERIRRIWEATNGVRWPQPTTDPEELERIAETMRGWGR